MRTVLPIGIVVFATALVLPSAAAVRTNVVERSYDRFGRLVGLSVDGERRSEIAYDGATGRIASMRVAGADEPFRWEYEPGSDLKNTLRYPNAAKMTWKYAPHRDLTTLVSNDVYSAYRYEYDAAGRRIAKNGERYEYNERGELILATNAVTGAEFAYRYDDIGNRLWSRELGTNCIYAANELNQYTNVVRGGVSERSAFDLDGNQTNIVTSTGEWAVEYNGENRPVRWTRASDGATVLMSYDRMGRRVRKNDETFVYDGYLNVGETVWDPTEPVATRPLANIVDGTLSLYTHDANKNVSDVVDATSGESAAHYVYSAFGWTFSEDSMLAYRNHLRFSSEFGDDETGLVYYNYRHYNHVLGRWCRRDPIGVSDARNELSFIDNDPVGEYDRVGLKKCRTDRHKAGYKPPVNGCGAEGGWSFPNSYFGLVDFTSCCNSHDVCYGTCGSDRGNCDKGLSACMMRACDKYFSLPISWHERGACRMMAQTYGFAVRIGGGAAYQAAQDKACEWEECCEKSTSQD